MNPAKLDRRITIQRKTTTQNDFGEVVEAWVLVATLWAERVQPKAWERFTAQQVMAEGEEKFKIRYRTDIGPLNRVIFEGRTFDIKGVIEIGRREGLEITCVGRAE